MFLSISCGLYFRLFGKIFLEKIYGGKNFRAEKLDKRRSYTVDKGQENDTIVP
jgi:hypothetical protein